MKKEIYYIDNQVGRIIMMFFFFFILSFSEKGSGLHDDNSTIPAEQVTDIQYSAITVKTPVIPCYGIFTVDHGFCDTIKSDIATGQWILNNTVNHRYKKEELRFLTFKPALLGFRTLPQKISNNEYYSLIS